MTLENKYSVTASTQIRISKMLISECIRAKIGPKKNEEKKL